MRPLIVILIAILLGGCVHATYDATPGSESLEVKTLFKSVDGFNAGRADESFNIKIDKTHTNDPVATMVQLMQMMRMMGYAPPPVVPPDVGDSDP